MRRQCLRSSHHSSLQRQRQQLDRSPGDRRDLGGWPDEKLCPFDDDLGPAVHLSLTRCLEVALGWTNCSTQWPDRWVWQAFDSPPRPAPAASPPQVARPQPQAPVPTAPAAPLPAPGGKPGAQLDRTLNGQSRGVSHVWPRMGGAADFQKPLRQRMGGGYRSGAIRAENGSMNWVGIAGCCWFAGRVLPHATRCFGA